MCASATAILHWCGIPVFCDIESDTFNLDPESIKKNITEYTKAIMVPDIWSSRRYGADYENCWRKYFKGNIRYSSSTCKENSKFAGTISDIGGFGLNYHKHIQTGGGILITNDDNYAERMQLIRNHGEAVVEGKGVKDISNIMDIILD